MLKDFHYYGTYVAACYAGYSADESQIIAHAAQYVDDSVHDRLINCGDYGIDFQPIPTCHTTEELEKVPFGKGPTLSELHQVWMPFHFLPGNYTSNTLPDPNASSRIKEYTGPTYDDLAQWKFKLLCLLDSPIAIAMINDIQKHNEQSYFFHLIGLRMHVLADTAAHEYYAGTPAWHVNDVGAKVYDLTVDPKKEVPWFNPLKFHFNGEMCTPNITPYYDSVFYLGHGRMGVVPDYPWIKYEYSPKWSSKPIIKDNPAEYLKIFRVMVTALKCIREQKSFDISNLEDIDSRYITVDNILRTKHDFGLGDDATRIRCEVWKKEIGDGSLGSVGMPAEYNENDWYNSIKQGQQLIAQTDYYKFNKAAVIHLGLVQRYLSQDLSQDGIPFNWGEPITNHQN